MKAIILAAGKGERLGVVTKKLPKPMIEIHGKPVLEHNLNMCRNAGIEDICINLHHLPYKIRDYFGDGSKYGLNITYNHETQLLGTAGALLPFHEILNEEPFFVIYGDNYMNFDLLDVKSYNDKKKADITVLFHWQNNISSGGIASFDKQDRVNKFIEKPSSYPKKGDWVNAGIYYIEKGDIFEYINPFDDFGFNVFPRLLENNYNIYGLKSNKNLIAIDTPELLLRNFKTN